MTTVSKEDTSCTATSLYLSFDNDDENEDFKGMLVSPGGATIEASNQNQQDDEDADRTPQFGKDLQENNSTLENISNAMLLTPGRRLTPSGASPFRSLTMRQYILREFRDCSTPTKDEGMPVTLKPTNTPGNMMAKDAIKPKVVSHLSERKVMSDNQDYNIEENLLNHDCGDKIPTVSLKVDNYIGNTEAADDKENQNLEDCLSEKSLNSSDEENKENISPNDSGEKTPPSSPFISVKSGKNEQGTGEEKLSSRLHRDSGYHQPLREITRPILKIAKQLLMPEVLTHSKSTIDSKHIEETSQGKYHKKPFLYICEAPSK